MASGEKQKLGNPNWGNGKSGNPNGRPPRGHSLSEALNRYLSQPAASDEKPKTKAAAIVHSLANKAINDGDTSAARELWSRHEGTVPQGVELTGEGGGPVTVVEWVVGGAKKTADRDE